VNVPPSQDDSLNLLRSRIEILRHRFVERSVNDAEVLLTAMDQGDRAGIGDRAHRLAGTAASFGYHQIGAEAAKLQQAIAGQASTEDLEAGVKRLVFLLKKCNLTSDLSKVCFK